MIVKWFLAALLGVVNWVAGLFPVIQPPEWLSSSDSKVNDMLDQVGSFGAWLPLQTILAVSASIFACLAIGLAIKVARIVASYATLGGGSAG